MQRIELLYRMCQCLRCDFCRCYKFHSLLSLPAESLLDSAGKLSAETNFNFLGNQLVSYTRQMDLVRIGYQAKFENASLRTKHFTI